MRQRMEAGRAIRGALIRAGDRVLARNLDGSVQRSGSRLLYRAECLAGALARQGLAGGVVGLSFRNSAAALEAFIAAELIGATRLPVEPAAAPAEAAAIFAAGGAGAVITDRIPGRPAAEPGAGPWASTELAPLTLAYDDDTPEPGARWAGSVTVAADRALALYPRAVIGGQLLGIPTSYANWDAIIELNIGLYASGGYGPPLGPGESYLTVVQLMHATGMVGAFPFLHLGRPQVLLPRFRPADVIEAVGAHQVTTLFAVPGMLTRIADALGGRPAPQLASLTRVLYGGAPVTPGELERIQATFGGALCQLYGRYEAGWPLTVLTPADHARIRAGDREAAGSCGRPAPGVEIGLVPLAGRDGRDGRAEVRTRSAMVSPLFADADGWCDLGDTGVLTPGGYLRLTGRRDDMINTGAFHVYPREVEQAILALPGITAARVTGEPDPRWGQAVVAYLVTADRAYEQTLRARLAGRLAPYKIPAVTRVVSELPPEG
jgi:acyl-CoA synthetase (AMP-forming)/AMP-acid ligase II